MTTLHDPGRLNSRERRRGAAAVELALLLPVLCFMAFLAVDFARVIPEASTIADCARSGALFASSAEIAGASPFTTAEEAARAAAAGFDPPPDVSITTGTDAGGFDYVEVTVSHTFRTIAGYPGIPSEVPLSRTVRMPILPN